MRKILVTGGAGYIGSHTILEIIEKCNFEVISIDNYSNSSPLTFDRIDRIDSSKGYVKGNVQWVHKNVNLMKGKFDQEYFIEMCKKITK